MLFTIHNCWISDLITLHCAFENHLPSYRFVLRLVINGIKFRQIMDKRVCRGCNQKIAEGILAVFVGQTWYHNECFKCNTCCKIIQDDGNFRSKALFCQEEYYHVNCFKCSKCCKIIQGNGKVSVFNEKYYHVDCLTCIKCCKPINEEWMAIVEENVFHKECNKCSSCCKAFDDKVISVSYYSFF